MFRRNRLLAHQPGQQIGCRDFEHLFELIELGLAHRADPRIGIAAKHEIDLATPSGLDLQWLHRPASLPDAVVGLSLPTGRGHAFVHGEAEEIRAIRRHLLTDGGFTRPDMSCSPYWRRTMTDEGWRSVKKDFVAAMEADV